jgi:rod shape-determining protein MreB
MSALQSGVIVDADAVVSVLEPLLAKVKVLGVVKPNVLTCAPSDVTWEERMRLVDTVVRSGATSVVVVPEPLAAAIGAEMDVSSPYAQMVIDIGDGVTDCAVIRSSRVLTGFTLRTGCAALRRALVQRAAVSEEQADKLLHSFGVSLLRNRLRHQPDDNVREEYERYCAAIAPDVEIILSAIDRFLKDIPAGMGAEVIDSGIVLTGGGALLPGIRSRVEEVSGIRISCPYNPQMAVIKGAHAILPVVTALNQWP